MSLLAICLSFPSCRQADPEIELARLEGDLLEILEVHMGLTPRFSGDFRNGGCSKIQDAESPQAMVCGAGIQGVASRFGGLEARATSLKRTLGTAKTARALAFLSIVGLPSRDLDLAVRLLRGALGDEHTGAALNDLAVTLLLRASFDRRPVDLIEALDLVDRAAPTGGEEPAIRFNRALILQQLGLWSEAETAWRKVLGRVDKRGWASEARARLTALAHAGDQDPTPGSPPAGSPHDHLALRRRGERSMGEWGTAVSQEKREGAVALLEAARKAAEIHAMVTGDRLLSDAVALADRVAEARDEPRLRTLAQGHRLFHRARGGSIYSDCAPGNLEGAAASFAAAGSPFHGWSLVDLAVCAYFDKDFAAADRYLTEARSVGHERRYIALEGRVEWMTGLIRTFQGRFSEGYDALLAATHCFEQIGERPHVIYLHTLLARNLEALGAHEEAWSHRWQALIGRRHLRDWERVHNMFEEATRALRNQGMSRIAVYFLSEWMRIAKEADLAEFEPDLVAYPLLDRAFLLAEQGRRDEARLDLRRAENLWRSLALHHESRRRLRRELELQEALLDDEPARLLAAIDRALNYFGGPEPSLGDRIETLELYRRRARIRLRTEPGLAAADLEHGVIEIERQRLTVAEPAQRARFLAQAQGLFDDMVRLQWEVLGQPLAALEFLERGTNRLLADALSTSPKSALAISPLTPERLRRALPPGTRVVRYGHVADRLMIWSFSEGRLTVEEKRISTEALAALVDRYRAALHDHRRAPELTESLRRSLSRWLLPRALADELREDPLIVIPGAHLGGVPFATLRGGEGQPLLIERFPVSYAPSLTHLLLTARDMPSVSPETRPLFIADPAFSHKVFPRLPDLRGARDAAPRYAERYRQSLILTRRDATREALLEALPDHDLLHFGGHAVTEPADPPAGGLVLAPAATGLPERATSLLTLRDLPPSLPNLRLVVLAACTTTLGTYPETREVTGLVAGFLARGVPRVVATLWPIEDRLAVRFFEIFHQRLAAGEVAEEALRQTQIRFLTAENPELADPLGWAGFQIFRTGAGNTADRPVQGL